MDDLLQVRALIERGWTQRCSARNKDGVPVEPTDDDAVSFCLFGAMTRVARDTGNVWDRRSKMYIKFARALGERYEHFGPVTFNDSPKRTKEEVLALIDKARHG